MAKVEIYSWQYCPFCMKAKSLLDSKGIQYEEYSIDGDPDARNAMKTRAEGRNTVPQIFINDKGIGGCDELFELEATNELEVLLKQAN